MPHDLEDELLRAIVAGSAAAGPRLAHPLLANLVEGLLARLVAGGWLYRDGDRYAPTERALAELAREPELLTTPIDADEPVAEPTVTTTVEQPRLDA